MRYEGDIYRPPSEADSYILQATIGCSWNKCTYCDMYRAKQFRVRPLAETLEDVRRARRSYGDRVEKVFVADGDALILTLAEWEPILDALRTAFPRLNRVSCYAMARNILEKSPAELESLRALGLTRLYIGPESGDERTLKRIAKGATFAEHVEAAQKARAAQMELSAIFLLGVAGVERSEAHAHASAALATAMDPEFLATLTVTVIAGTPLARMQAKDLFALPDLPQLLHELRIFVAEANPSDSLFRSNHASNYLPIGGRLPHDRVALLQHIDAALAGTEPLRPEWARGL